MRLPGKTYTNPRQTNANKYLYNGKELQNDFGIAYPSERKVLTNKSGSFL